MPMKKLQVAVADGVAVGGLATFGYGLYTTFGLGWCCLVVGAVVTALGVFLDREARS